MNTFIDGDLLLRDGDYYGGSMKIEWLTAGDGEYDWNLYWRAYQGGNVAVSMSHDEALNLADKIQEIAGKDLDEAQRRRLHVAALEDRIQSLSTDLRAEHFRRIKFETAMRTALQEMDIDKIKIYLGGVLDSEWS